MFVWAKQKSHISGTKKDVKIVESTDYEVKARKVDAEYNGWPYQRGGPPGPVLTLLRSLPPVTGLGVGFAGEFSREVGQFFSAALACIIPR